MAICLPLLAAAAMLVSAQQARAAFPGKNGLIAFSRSKHSTPGMKTGDIWVVDPSAVKEIDITNTTAFFEDEPAFAPDGRTIAYSWKDGAGTGGGIGVVESNGAGIKHLVTAAAGETVAQPAWTADGRTILFQKIGANSVYSIWAVDAASGAQHSLVTFDSSQLGNITNGASPLGSPDGTRIAYFANGEQLADPSGAHPVSATDPSFDAADWSPDGARFVYPLNGTLHGIFTSAIDGSGQTQVADLPVQDVDPAYSPDGQWIIWTNEGTHDIWIVAAGGGQPRNLTHQPGFELNPSWGKAASGSTAPGGSLTGNRTQKLGKTITVTVACDEVCTAKASGSVKVRKPAKSYKLTPATKALAAGTRGGLSLRIPVHANSALRSALKQHRKVQAKLKVVVKDIFGNTRTLTRTVTLRR